jgi:DNA-binding response OmpR family regulator
MSAESLRLLLIEDDALLRDRVLVPRLTQFGFEVMAIGHVEQMAQAIGRRKPDIVLLDIGLPGRDGFEIARTLRTQSADIGIVMLTGRSEAIDRVRGLSEGADAYLSKPVEIDVLVATLHSVARRLRPLAHSIAPTGSWKLDSDDWLLISPSGMRVILSKTERRLLEELMKQPNQVVVREILIGAITDDVAAFDPHRLDSLIHRLRRKVLAAAGEPLPLNAVHGQGYLLATS